MTLHWTTWAWIRRNILQPMGLTPERVRDSLGSVPEFLVVLVFFIVVARIGAWVMRKTLWSPKRIDPMVSTLFTTLLQGLVIIMGFAAALTVFGVNIFGVALTVGLVGAGLALGLQNTVANMMGGVSLALDRPFEVGDRIQIGETWGDVEQIGLRSTSILTIRRELVTIPNRVLDSQEIWNYSGRYPEIRVDVEMAISYDSDWRLARQEMLGAARAHPDTLPFPAPEVLVTGFGESAVHLELRTFIPDARQQRRVASDLRGALKDRFDKVGLEIPFPYRTLVYKTDLPEPAQMEGLDTSVHSLGPRRLLVATAGAQPARSKARAICEIAAGLGADLVVVYITQRRHIGAAREGEKAAAVFQAAADDHHVRVRARIEEGEVVETVARVAEEEGCAGVVIGAPRQHVLLSWTSAGVPDRLRRRLSIPLLVVPEHGNVPEGDIRQVRRQLDEIDPPEPPEVDEPSSDSPT